MYCIHALTSGTVQQHSCCCIRRQRGLGLAGQAGYQPLDGCPDGMTAEQMRALPIVIAEKRSRRTALGDAGETAEYLSSFFSVKTNALAISQSPGGQKYDFEMHI